MLQTVELSVYVLNVMFTQDDWSNYTDFTAAIGKEVQVVGDDLLVTNVKRIEEASSKKACNALLLKVRSVFCVVAWLPLCVCVLHAQLL
jgi:enolase